MIAFPFTIAPGAAVDATSLQEAIIAPISHMCHESLNAAATTPGLNRDLVISNGQEQLKTHERLENYRIKIGGTSAFYGQTPTLDQLPLFMKGTFSTPGGETTHLLTNKTFKDGSSAASHAILFHLEKVADHPLAEGTAPRPVDMEIRATAWIGGVPYALEDYMRAYLQLQASGSTRNIAGIPSTTIDLLREAAATLAAPRYNLPYQGGPAAAPHAPLAPASRQSAPPSAWDRALRPAANPWGAARFLQPPQAAATLRLPGSNIGLPLQPLPQPTGSNANLAFLPSNPTPPRTVEQSMSDMATAFNQVAASAGLGQNALGTRQDAERRAAADAAEREHVEAAALRAALASQAAAVAATEAASAHADLLATIRGANERLRLRPGVPWSGGGAAVPDSHAATSSAAEPGTGSAGGGDGPPERLDPAAPRPAATLPGVRASVSMGDPALPLAAPPPAPAAARGSATWSEAATASTAPPPAASGSALPLMPGASPVGTGMRLLAESEAYTVLTRYNLLGGALYDELAKQFGGGIHSQEGSRFGVGKLCSALIKDKDPRHIAALIDNAAYRQEQISPALAYLEQERIDSDRESNAYFALARIAQARGGQPSSDSGASGNSDSEVDSEGGSGSSASSSTRASAPLSVGPKGIAALLANASAAAASGRSTLPHTILLRPGTRARGSAASAGSAASTTDSSDATIEASLDTSRRTPAGRPPASAALPVATARWLEAAAVFATASAGTIVGAPAAPAQQTAATPAHAAATDRLLPAAQATAVALMRAADAASASTGAGTGASVAASAPAAPAQQTAASPAHAAATDRLLPAAQATAAAPMRAADAASASTGAGTGASGAASAPAAPAQQTAASPAHAAATDRLLPAAQATSSAPMRAADAASASTGAGTGASVAASAPAAPARQTAASPAHAAATDRLLSAAQETAAAPMRAAEAASASTGTGMGASVAASAPAAPARQTAALPAHAAATDRLPPAAQAAAAAPTRAADAATASTIASGGGDASNVIDISVADPNGVVTFEYYNFRQQTLRDGIPVDGALRVRPGLDEPRPRDRATAYDAFNGDLAITVCELQEHHIAVGYSSLDVSNPSYGTARVVLHGDVDSGRPSFTASALNLEASAGVFEALAVGGARTLPAWVLNINPDVAKVLELAADPRNANGERGSIPEILYGLINTVSKQHGFADLDPDAMVAVIASIRSVTILHSNNIGASEMGDHYATAVLNIRLGEHPTLTVYDHITQPDPTWPGGIAPSAKPSANLKKVASIIFALLSAAQEITATEGVRSQRHLERVAADIIKSNRPPAAILAPESATTQGTMTCGILAATWAIAFSGCASHSFLGDLAALRALPPGSPGRARLLDALMLRGMTAEYHLLLAVRSAAEATASDESWADYRACPLSRDSTSTINPHPAATALARRLRALPPVPQTTLIVSPFSQACTGAAQASRRTPSLETAALVAAQTHADAMNELRRAGTAPTAWRCRACDLYNGKKNAECSYCEASQSDAALPPPRAAQLLQAAREGAAPAAMYPPAPAASLERSGRSLAAATATAAPPAAAASGAHTGAVATAPATAPHAEQGARRTVAPRPAAALPPPAPSSTRGLGVGPRSVRRARSGDAEMRGESGAEAASSPGPASRTRRALSTDTAASSTRGTRGGHPPPAPPGVPRRK